MGMKVTVKVRFKASRETFEKFGDGMYLVYLPYEEEESSHSLLANMISKKIGLPINRIEFAGKDVKGNYVYELV